MTHDEAVIIDQYYNYVKERISSGDPEPFCPFAMHGGYCNDAYSGKCYPCEMSWLGWVVDHKEE